MSEIETPKQLLKKEVAAYIKKKTLIQQVVASATPAKNGFVVVISDELMEQLRQFVA